MNKSDDKFYLNELKSNECGCGNDKKTRYAFCFKCYFALPPELRIDLYKPIGRGFGIAYERAFQWLKFYVW